MGPSNTSRSQKRTRTRRSTNPSELSAPTSTTTAVVSRKPRTRRRPRSEEVDSCHHQPSFLPLFEAEARPDAFRSRDHLERLCLTEFMLCQLACTKRVSLL